ncbi:MAG: glycoside hydrolase family 65 protein [Treponema sp.]|jgi:trehalose/maltose hydrolase-like predicted phosphorylase|nr:glycoside hydrolase family 65 protein [Treponema sp.]
MYRLGDWDIADDGLGADDVLQNGNRLLTGNGYLGRRGVVDEAAPEDMPATILAGVYDKRGGLWREPVNAPDPLYVLLGAEGLPLKAGGENTAFHEQALNFRYGIYSRKTSFRLPGSDGRVTLRAERFAHMESVHLLCARYALKADAPCRVVIKQGINAGIKDLNGPHLGDFVFSEETGLVPSARILKLSCSTLEKRIPLYIFSVMIIQGGKGAELVKEDKGIFTSRALELDGVTEAEFFIYGVIFTGLDFAEGGSSAPEKAAKDLIASAANEGWESLLKRHKEKWDGFWRKGDVVIEGDEYAQRCLRYSLYHLWIIAPRHCQEGGRALSVPARGLSGQTYKGAVFWDTEMFVAPYFLAVEPELAAQFIRYRIQTLSGAKRKAAEYGYRGAFFAWESQETGDDACSDFNVTDVFTGRPVRTYFRDKQVHISADIVYFIKKYADCTGDTGLLAEAMELILETARFYLSYLYYSPERKRYEVLDVIGPDEYHERVNNNAFTNRMILSVFETAKGCIEEFRKNDPGFIESLISRIGFNEDLQFMETAAKQLYIPQPDERGLIEQFDGYFRLEDCSLDEVRSRLKDPREYWGGGTGVASTTRIIKQADAAAMLALFGDCYPDDVKKANLDFYEPRTEHGSSLSSCMYALLACQTGGSGRAYPFFIKSAEIDITGKSKHFAGLVYIGGTHPAGNGGAWLTAVHGFCGLSIEDGKIKIVPRLPAQWKKVTFAFIFKGVEYEVTVAKDDYSICRK